MAHTEAITLLNKEWMTLQSQIQNIRQYTHPDEYRDELVQWLAEAEATVISLRASVAALEATQPPKPSREERNAKLNQALLDHWLKEYQKGGTAEMAIVRVITQLIEAKAIKEANAQAYVRRVRTLAEGYLGAQLDEIGKQFEEGK